MESAALPTPSDEAETSHSGLETIYCQDMSQGVQPTVVLVNGQLPPQEQVEQTALVIETRQGPVGVDGAQLTAALLENGTSPASPATGSGEGAEVGGGGSSRNSSGDAMSLRETLRQLPTPIVGAHRSHHSRHSRTHSVSPHSPQSPLRQRALDSGDGSNSGGILGFMERELRHAGSPTSTAARKAQTLSDPQASPAPRSLRSRSSLERSPRRKRSKSESRRRRERKLIAAGEMEVRQANETLMRYLKQCSEMNDASLSGELEIDQNLDEGRVKRKTRSQRDKRGHLMNKLYTAGGLSSILKELSDDIAPADGEEIYNPFTPVVSPTDEDTPAHIDKMFMQTSSGYRPLEHCYYRHTYASTHHHHRLGNAGVGLSGVGHGQEAAGVGGVARVGSNVGSLGTLTAGGSCSTGATGGNDLRSSISFGESRCLLDGDCHR